MKDPYYDRPLPHIIGSEEWHKKWHVGLQESSSESENEAAVSEKFSDTDSETDLPVSNRATNTVQVVSVKCISLYPVCWFNVKIFFGVSI